MSSLSLSTSLCHCNYINCQDLKPPLISASFLRNQGWISSHQLPSKRFSLHSTGSSNGPSDTKIALKEEESSSSSSSSQEEERVVQEFNGKEVAQLPEKEGERNSSSTGAPLLDKDLKKVNLSQNGFS